MNHAADARQAPPSPASPLSMRWVGVIGASVAAFLALATASSTYLSMLTHGHSFVRLLGWQLGYRTLGDRGPVGCARQRPSGLLAARLARRGTHGPARRRRRGARGLAATVRPGHFLRFWTCAGESVVVSASRGSARVQDCWLLGGRVLAGHERARQFDFANRSSSRSSPARSSTPCGSRFSRIFCSTR